MLLRVYDSLLQRHNSSFGPVNGVLLRPQSSRASWNNNYYDYVNACCTVAYIHMHIIIVTMHTTLLVKSVQCMIKCVCMCDIAQEHRWSNNVAFTPECRLSWRKAIYQNASVLHSCAAKQYTTSTRMDQCCHLMLHPQLTHFLHTFSY